MAILVLLGVWFWVGEGGDTRGVAALSVEPEVGDIVPARADSGNGGPKGHTSTQGLRLLVRDTRGEPIGRSVICLLSGGESVLPMACWPAEGGESQIETPPMVDYRIWVGSPSHGPTQIPMPSAPPIPGRTLPEGPLLLTLSSSDAVVSGVVVDAAGGTVEGALLLLKPGGRVSVPALCMSEDEGHFTCVAPEGSAMGLVEASAEGYARSVRHVPIPSSNYRISLFPESRILGVVLDKERVPVMDVPVSLKPSILDARFEATLTTSNSFGEFEFQQLEPGTYRALVDGGSYRLIGEPPVVQVGYGGVSDRIELMVESGHRLTIDIRDEHRVCEGPGAALVVDRESATLLAHRAGGGLEISAVPTGNHLLRCSCLNGIVREREVDVSTDSTVVCDYDFGATVEGRVRSDSGQGVSGASVNIVGQERYAISSEDGAFVLGALPAGDILLEVYARGFRPSRSQRFHLEDAQRVAGVDFSLHEGACVEGAVELLLEGNDELTLVSRMHGDIQLSKGDRSFRACGFDAGASEAFSVGGPLGPLPVSLSRSGPFAGSVRLTAEDPSRLVTILVDNRYFRLRGTVRASGEPVEGATVLAVRVAEGKKRCFRPRLGAAASAATHADGEFLFDLLPAGPWMIAAQGPEGEDGCAFLVVDEDSDIRIDIGMSAP